MEANISLEAYSTEYELLQAYHRKRKSSLPPCDKAALMGNLEQCSTVVSVETDLNNVADKLVQIVDETPLPYDEIFTITSPDVIERLVELLKECGDSLNEEILKDQELLGCLQSSFSYSLFEKVASVFIGSIFPASKPKEKAVEQKAQIAWTFEMTSRLSTLNQLPGNKVMGFGAQFLHQHFGPWIQKCGNWKKAIHSDENEEVQ